MMGAEIRCNTIEFLSYIPVIVQDCRQDGHQDCQVDGSITDMFRAIQGRYNFTYTIDREPNDNWGLSPTQGNLQTDIQIN